MNNDGWGQMGAGASDKRLVGDDVQHYIQGKTADEMPYPKRMVRQAAGQGGPVKEALDEEQARHTQSVELRLKHLEDHYKR